MRKAPAKVTEVVPTQAEEPVPTQAEPTQAEPTQAEPTQAEPTQAEPTQAEPTQVVPIHVVLICKGTVLGKACTREAVKGKDLCKQCHVNHAKKEREAAKKIAPPPAAAAPAAVTATSSGSRALVVYDEAKHLFRNLHTNWIVYDTDTVSQVIGIAQGDDIVPLTQTEREAVLRAGYTVKADEEDPEATQVDPLLAPAAAAPAAAAPAPSTFSKKTLMRPKKTTLPPPPTLPIPTSELSEASTIPL